jgi:hypothetical protein
VGKGGGRGKTYLTTKCSRTKQDPKHVRTKNALEQERPRKTNGKTQKKRQLCIMMRKIEQKSATDGSIVTIIEQRCHQKRPAYNDARAQEHGYMSLLPCVFLHIPATQDIQAPLYFVIYITLLYDLLYLHYFIV